MKSINRVIIILSLTIIFILTYLFYVSVKQSKYFFSSDGKRAIDRNNGKVYFHEQDHGWVPMDSLYKVDDMSIKQRLLP